MFLLLKMLEKVIETSALSNQLGAVVIESCNTRWKNLKPSKLQSNSTLDIITAFKTVFHTNIKKLLKNEMKASFDMANKYSVITVLGAYHTLL